MAQGGDTLMHRWFEEVWNQGRESTIDELMASDAIAHGITDSAGNTIKGPDAFKEFYRKFRAAFPDLRIAVEDALTDDDRIAVRCVVTGIHTGPGLIAQPTGKAAQFTGMCIVRIKDGKIVEAWNNFDFLSLYQQLGMQLS